MNIVILGAGTAGLLTALYCQKNFKTDNITLIKNEKTGIIGVGEATTPIFVDFIRYLNINPDLLITECGATIKQGISFENWNGDNQKYFHGFLEKNELYNFSIKDTFNDECYTFYLNHLINKKLKFNEHIYASKLSYLNKVDIKNISFALHFDTHRINTLLLNECIKRNIKIIDDNYKKVETNENGYIKKIILDKHNLNVDFIFDCSGLNRLIIQDHFKEKWISYRKHLPMNRAIPFYLEMDNNIKPYTQAISLPHGWMWKIPLQDRYGAGYVYSGDHINEDQAKLEVENFLKQKVKVNKLIKFEAGKFSNYWIKNCLAVGLSTSFIEPLESTSIHLAVQQLKLLSFYKSAIYDLDNTNIKNYNERANLQMEEILHFVYLHYICKRNDTDFWKNFQKNYKVPEKFKDQLFYLKKNLLKYFNLNNDNFSSFDLSSFLKVAEGLDIFEQETNIKGYEELSPTIYEYKELIKKNMSSAENHNDFLKRVKNI